MDREQAWTIGFDADDTLWHNEDSFADVEGRFRDLLAPWSDPDVADAALVDTARRRMEHYGYGAKSFALSMIETAVELSGGEIPATKLTEILDWAHDLLKDHTEMIDGALDVVRSVAQSHDVMVITKGDLHHQLRRIATSGVAALVRDVEVLHDKRPDTYQRLLQRHQVESSRFVMVGNSIASDIAPVLALGARAVHIPYAVTWDLEIAADPPPSDRWTRLENIAELPEALESWTSQ